MKSTKKGISPIITTVLLILIAIILAVIILLWARGFISEKVSKFVPSESQDRPIEEACNLVSLSAGIDGNQLSVVNQGDIPVYKLNVRVTNSVSGDSTIKEYDTTGLNPGQTKLLTTAQSLSGNKVEIEPILIGKSDKNGNVEYNCKIWLTVLQ